MIYLLGVIWSALSFGFLWWVLYHCFKGSKFVRRTVRELMSREYLPQTRLLNGGVLLYSEGEYFMIHPTKADSLQIAYTLPPLGKHFKTTPLNLMELEEIFGVTPEKILPADID